MLPKSKRVQRSGFKPLIESKTFIHSPHFTLKMAQSSHFRAAVTVSKRVSKKAVDRNRVRRRAYTVVTKLDLPAKMYLVVAKPGSERLTFDEFARELGSLFKKS